jgi:hypothetical protein
MAGRAFLEHLLPRIGIGLGQQRLDRHRRSGATFRDHAGNGVAQLLRSLVLVRPEIMAGQAGQPKGHDTSTQNPTRNGIETTAHQIASPKFMQNIFYAPLL